MAEILEFPAARMGSREPWLTRKEIAGHYGVSIRLVDHWIADDCPSLKLRGARRLRLSAVDAWLAHRDGQPPGVA